MATSLVDAETLLAIDVGSVNTRAFMFDVAEGAYRFLAVGQAPTTTSGPYHDIGEGVRLSLERLQEITGRTLIAKDGRLIIPRMTEGSGTDIVVSTISTGPSLQTVVVGLLPDVSMESGQRLAASTYSRVAETIGLNDRRRMELQIDSLIRAQPDLVILTGGTEGGASRSVMKMLEVVGLACYLLPEGKRPQVIYAGNSAVTDKVKNKLAKLTTLHISPNLRPTFAQEDLRPAQEKLSEVVTTIRMSQLVGLPELSGMVAGRIQPTSYAFGRMIRFFNQAYAQSKGVLGVDVGANTTTIAAGAGGKLYLHVNNNLGMGMGIKGLLPHVTPADIVQWLPMHVQEDYIRDYLYNKSIYPGSVPASLEDLAIEQSIARHVIRIAMRQAAHRYPAIAFNPVTGLTTPFEPVLASGAVLTQAPTPGQAMLMLLDSIQPNGITTIALDQNNLTASLGAASGINPLIPVQVIDSGVYLNLGMVIAPVSSARYGTPIMRVRVEFADGNESRVEVKQGTITVLPVPFGQKARLWFELMHHTSIGLNDHGKVPGLTVTGGVLGTVIDARGRPLALPADASRRRDLFKKWLWTLGG